MWLREITRLCCKRVIEVAFMMGDTKKHAVSANDEKVIREKLAISL